MSNINIRFNIETLFHSLIIFYYLKKIITIINTKDKIRINNLKKKLKKSIITITNKSLIVKYI